jgi:hypothetical protein
MTTPAWIQTRYELNRDTPSDINEHLSKLREYADKCQHVTEIGVRGCVSLFAFLSSNAERVVALDIANVAVPETNKLHFICGSSLDVEIEETDFLFIDSLHTYEQLSRELFLHARNVKKYIGFHDTEIFGTNGETGGIGLNQAIEEFMSSTHPEWVLEYRTTINNGLTILRRA